MSLLAIVLILILVFGTGGFYVGPYAGYGHPSLGGVLPILLVIVVLLIVFGRI